MIASTKIIVVLAFKLLSRKVLLMNRKTVETVKK